MADQAQHTTSALPPGCAVDHIVRLHAISSVAAGGVASAITTRMVVVARPISGKALPSVGGVCAKLILHMHSQTEHRNGSRGRRSKTRLVLRGSADRDGAVSAREALCIDENTGSK